MSSRNRAGSIAHVSRGEVLAECVSVIDGGEIRVAAEQACQYLFDEVCGERHAWLTGCESEAGT